MKHYRENYQPLVPFNPLDPLAPPLPFPIRQNVVNREDDLERLIYRQMNSLRPETLSQYIREYLDILKGRIELLNGQINQKFRIDTYNLALGRPIDIDMDDEEQGMFGSYNYYINESHATIGKIQRIINSVLDLAQLLGAIEFQIMKSQLRNFFRTNIQPSLNDYLSFWTNVNNINLLITIIPDLFNNEIQINKIEEISQLINFFRSVFN